MRDAIRNFFVLGAILFAGSALGQSVAQSARSSVDLANFHGTKNTLINAIRDIQKSGGGRVIEIRYTESDGNPGYHVVLARRGHVQFIHVEKLSNSVTLVDASSRPVWMLNWRRKEDVRLAEHAPVSLAKAIRTAEEANNGAPAFAAGIARSASNPDSDIHACNILLDVNNSPLRVAVDDSTGEIIADPRALADWP